MIGDGKGLAGRQANSTGGGQASGRRKTHRIQGGDDGGRSQDGDRRSQGRPDGGRRQEGLGAGGARRDPGRTQATAKKATHGGGMAADSRGATDGGGAGGRGARDGDREPISQGNEEDPEEQMAPRRSDRGGAGGKEEPDRARGTRCSWRSGVPR